MGGVPLTAESTTPAVLSSEPDRTGAVEPSGAASNDAWTWLAPPAELRASSARLWAQLREKSPQLLAHCGLELESLRNQIREQSPKLVGKVLAEGSAPRATARRLFEREEQGTAWWTPKPLPESAGAPTSCASSSALFDPLPPPALPSSVYAQQPDENLMPMPPPPPARDATSADLDSLRAQIR